MLSKLKSKGSAPNSTWSVPFTLSGTSVLPQSLIIRCCSKALEEKLQGNSL